MSQVAVRVGLENRANPRQAAVLTRGISIESPGLREERRRAVVLGSKKPVVRVKSDPAGPSGEDR